MSEKLQTRGKMMNGGTFAGLTICYSIMQNFTASFALAYMAILAQLSMWFPQKPMQWPNESDIAVIYCGFTIVLMAVIAYLHLRLRYFKMHKMLDETIVALLPKVWGHSSLGVFGMTIGILTVVGLTQSQKYMFADNPVALQNERFFAIGILLFVGAILSRGSIGTLLALHKIREPVTQSETSSPVTA